jgi:hypothetical protein
MAKIKSSDERSKISRMNYNFSRWFLTSIHMVHSLHELTAYIEVYLYKPQIISWILCEISSQQEKHTYIQKWCEEELNY